MVTLDQCRRDSRDEEAHRFQLFDAANGTNGLNGCAKLNHATSLKKDVSEHLTQNGSDFNPEVLKSQINANPGLWDQLKAIPLISYYKQHRVTPVAAMEGQPQEQANGNTPIELPRKESISAVEPPNGVVNKALENVIRTPGRQPSPQPTHLSVPGPAHHRILQEQGTGYVAPVFEGKEKQMEEGSLSTCPGYLRAPLEAY